MAGFVASNQQSVPLSCDDSSGRAVGDDFDGSERDDASTSTPLTVKMMPLQHQQKGRRRRRTWRNISLVAIAAATGSCLLLLPQSSLLSLAPLWEQHQQYDMYPPHFRHLRTKKESHPATGNSRSYSSYVGYHKRSERPKDVYNGYYAFDDDDTDSSGQTSKSKAVGSATGSAAWWQKRLPQNRDETDLGDVWFCLGLALAWLTWMLRSFLKSELMRYSKDAVMVRGHVLQVTLGEETSLGTGIPTYKAVIDYVVQDPKIRHGASAATTSDEGTEHTAEHTIQIRKHFETQTHLEQGFANVELLVLHDEPTHSVLREDWLSQMEEMEEEEKEGVICIPNKWWKRAWIGLCAAVVLLSLSGAIVAVHLLPSEDRSVGWICVCVGVTLLVPLALIIRMVITRIQRSLENQAMTLMGNGKSGVIIRGSSATMGSASAAGTTSGGLENYCMDCDAFDNVLDPSACEDEQQQAMAVAADRANRRAQQAAARGKIKSTSSDDSGYVIRMPPRNNMGERDRSEISDVSSVSVSVTQTPDRRGRAASDDSSLQCYIPPVVHRAGEHSIFPALSPVLSPLHEVISTLSPPSVPARPSSPRSEGEGGDTVGRPPVVGKARTMSP